MLKKKEHHWPTLNTVIMVEDTLKNMEDSVMSVAELKRKLPRKVNHSTLMLILQYLEESGKILVGLKGITWIYMPREQIEKLIEGGLEV